MLPARISMCTLYLHQGCSLLMLAWDCLRKPASLIQALLHDAYRVVGHVP